MILYISRYKKSCNESMILDISRYIKSYNEINGELL